MPLNLLGQPGGSSFPDLFTLNPTPAPAEQTITNAQIANSQVTPPIDATIQSNPYNFLLGTPGGANDKTAVGAGAGAVFPVDNGDPYFDLSASQVFASLGSAGSTSPNNLDPAIFEGWTQTQQQIYLNAWGLNQALIGGDVNGGAGAVVATASSTGVATTSILSWGLAQAADIDASETGTGGATSYYEGLFQSDDPALSSAAAQVDFATSPADLNPATFQSWTPAAQGIYLLYYDGVAPAQTVIGSSYGDGSQALVVESQTDASGAITVASSAPILTWALAQAKSLDSSATFAAPTGSAPLDLGAYGSVAPASLDPSVFEGWTSQQQAEYLRSQGVTTYAVIGSGANAVTAVLSQDPTRPNTVYIVNDLQASDLAKISSADLQLVESTPAFQNSVGPALGLTNSVSAAQQSIQGDIDAILGSTTTVTGTASNLGAPFNIFSSSGYTGAIPTNGSSTTLTKDASGNVTSVATNVVTSDAGGVVTDTVTTISNGSATIDTTTYTPQSGGGYLVDETEQMGVGSLTTSAVNGVTPPTPGTTVSGNTTTTNYTNPDGSSTTVTSVSNGTSLTTVTVADATSNTVQVNGASYAGMPYADKQVFIDELNLLSQQIAASGLSGSQASSAAQQIMQRFDQAAVYWGQLALPTKTSKGVTSGVMSTDSDVSLTNAYQTFITQEKSILQAQENAENLLSASQRNAQQLDAPTASMIALTSSMSAQQAEIQIGSTQLQQIQTLLQQVGSMQNLVNSTVNALGTNPGTNTTGLTTGNQAVSGSATTNLTQSQLTLAEMFSSNIAGISPILKQYGITPPNITLINSDGTLSQYDQNQWNNIGTQLSTLVTELQQQAQTLTTQLSQQTQQMNNTYTTMTGIAGQMGTVINTIGANMAG